MWVKQRPHVGTSQQEAELADLRDHGKVQHVIAKLKNEKDRSQVDNIPTSLKPWKPNITSKMHVLE